MLNLLNPLGQSQHVTFLTGPALLPALIQAPELRNGALIHQVESNLLFLQKKLALAPTQIADAVSIDPVVMHGNPVFRGTRVPIYQVIEELADGTPFDQLVDGYPSLDPEKIRRGLDFAASVLRIYDDEISR